MSDEEKKQSSIKVDTGSLTKTTIAFTKKLSPVAAHIAKGEVVAMGIKAAGMVEVSENMRRAGYRILWKEGNIDSIIRIAEEYMSPDGREEKAKNLNQDWAVTFADKCGNTSDEDMQVRWAKILAGEADNPGTFSKKTLSVLSDMSKEDAVLFISLCQFVWWDDCNKPYALLYPNSFQYENPIYQSQGIDFDSLEHLESMGLIRCQLINGFVDDKIDSEYKIWHYHNIFVKIKGRPLLDSKTNKYYIPIGHVILTQMGRELALVSGAVKNNKFFSYVIDIWKEEGLEPAIQNPETK